MKLQHAQNMLIFLRQASAVTAFSISCAFSLSEAVTAQMIFNPPAGGAPQGTRGGASRGDLVCAQNSTGSSPRQLIVLAPTEHQYGLTLVERPKFFAYIPPTSAREAVFSLKDEAGEVIYQAKFAIAEAGGIAQISLPDTAPSLEIGKTYQWGIAVLCSGKLRADSPFVDAWIKRIQPSASLAEQMKQSSSLEQAKFYSMNGIWYDALMVLAELKSERADDTHVRILWKDLLGSVGLNAIASEPLSQRSNNHESEDSVPSSP